MRPRSFPKFKTPKPGYAGDCYNIKFPGLAKRIQNFIKPSHRTNQLKVVRESWQKRYVFRRRPAEMMGLSLVPVYILVEAGV